MQNRISCHCTLPVLDLFRSARLGVLFECDGLAAEEPAIICTPFKTIMDSSCCFLNKLGAVESETQDRLQKWAACDELHVFPSQNGDLHMYCMRRSSSEKSHKLALRNYCQFSKLSVGKFKEFRLLSAEEFNDAKTQIESNEDKTTTSEAMALPPLEKAVIVQSLPADFDAWAQRLYEEGLAKRAVRAR